MRTLAFAAALLLAGPACADWRQVLVDRERGAEWPAFEKAYLEHIVAIMARLETMRLHLAFVQREKISLRIVLPGVVLEESTLGAYDDRKGTMYLNKQMLLDGIRQLRIQGRSDRDIPEILAWKTLHVVAHEIRHGLHDRGRDRVLGRPFGIHYIENEYIAFLDQIAVVTEILRTRPELWSRGNVLDIEANVGVLMTSVTHSIELLQRLVRETPGYRRLPSLLGMKRTELLEHVDGRLRGLDAVLAEYRGALEEHLDPVEARARHGLAKRKVREAARALRRARAVAADPEAHAKVYRFVKADLYEAEERLIASRRPE